MENPLDAPQDSITRRTSQMIGRTEYKEMIRGFINDEAGVSDIIYFFGPGGIGKTRLLEEIAVIQHEAASKLFLWSKIIDLYHASNHSPDGLRQAIADGLDPQRRHFREYWRLHEESEQKRREGVTVMLLEDLLRQLDLVFQQEYAVLAQQQRLVLCFDTLELIQYESDLIQKISQVQDVNTTIKNWLLGQIGQFPNTVTLLAGRPHELVQRDFEQELSQTTHHFELCELKAFTESEIYAYLDEMIQQHAKLEEMLSPHIRNQIVEITGGRPIYLTLLIDLMLQDQLLSRIFPVTDRTPDIDEVGRQLVDHLLHLPSPFGQMVYFLMHARKGLDADLLRYLIGERENSSAESKPRTVWSIEGVERLWTEAEIQANLALMRTFAFVKTRPGTAQLFLHDEVYDLFDRYFQESMRTPGLYASIAQYYHQQLETHSVVPAEEVAIALLYYELQAHVRAGYYQQYVLRTEEAIKSHETSFDMRLRDELLRFLNRYTVKESSFYNESIAARVDRDAIERDFAVGWVKRHMARTRYSEALEVAETILDLGPDLGVGKHGKASHAPQLTPALRAQAQQLFNVNEPLFWGHLLTYYGEVLAYTSAPEERSVPVLQKAVTLLEHTRSTGAATAWPEYQRMVWADTPVEEGQPAEQALWEWLCTRVLGRAHNNLGHIAWGSQHLGQAIEHYKTAINFYRQLNILDEIADSMNNLAYVYGIKGEISWAEKLADDALELRHRLNKKFPLALSLNTRGLIHNFAHQPHRARPRCREALAIFEELQDRRGIGLASIALGHTLRLIANQWQDNVYSPDEAVKMYTEALNLLTQAISAIGAERRRLIEAYNERGAVYRDWAILEQTRHQHEPAGIHGKLAQMHFERAEADFKQSLDQAGQDFQADRADSQEDIADIFFRRSQYLQGAEQQHMLVQARTYLDAAEELIPSRYRLVPGTGFQPVEDPIEAMWQMMGKLHLARGHQELVPFSGRKDMTDEHREALLMATEHYTLAMIYLLRFAPNADAHRNATDSIYRRLKVYGLGRLELVHERVRQMAGEYQADVTPLLKMIDDVLGLRSQLL